MWTYSCFYSADLHVNVALEGNVFHLTWRFLAMLFFSPVRPVLTPLRCAKPKTLHGGIPAYNVRSNKQANAHFPSPCNLFHDVLLFFHSAWSAYRLTLKHCFCFTPTQSARKEKLKKMLHSRVQRSILQDAFWWFFLNKYHVSFRSPMNATAHREVLSPGPLREIVPGVQRLTPGPLLFGTLVATCIASFYSNQNTDKTQKVQC